MIDYQKEGELHLVATNDGSRADALISEAG